MRLQLMRTHRGHRPRSQNHRQNTTNSTTTANRHRHGGNAFHKLITRCRLPCVRCSSDTASLASDLQYHSPLDTPVYLPRQLVGVEQQHHSEGSSDDVDEDQVDQRDACRLDEEDQDTDLSLFSNGLSETRDCNLTCNRNLGHSHSEDEFDPMALDIGLCTSRYVHHEEEHQTYSRLRPTGPTRINTNFIPLAFNSHRSWLERIHLGSSVSSSDDFSHLLDAEEEDVLTDDDHQSNGSLEEESDGLWNIPNYINVEAPRDEQSYPDNINHIDLNRMNGIEFEINANNNILDNRPDLDYETLPSSVNRLGSCLDGTDSPLSNDDTRSPLTNNDLLMDMLVSQNSRISPQSSILIDLWGDHSDVRDTQIVPTAADNFGNFVPSTTASTSSEGIFYLGSNSSSSSSSDQPLAMFAAEQATVSSMENTMPESLRFLFQPLTATSISNSNSTQITTSSVVMSSDPGNTTTTTQRSAFFPSITDASLNGYRNLPEVPQTCNSPSVSQTSSLVNLQQNWYIYDPRLNPLHREDRVNVQMRWRGVQTALSMPAMIGPPDYDDLSSHNEDTVSQEPPPPYYPDDQVAGLAPPPTYDEAILESLQTDLDRREHSQGQGDFAESGDTNVSETTLPSNNNNYRAAFGFTDDSHVNIADENDADDLDSNVILSTTNTITDVFGITSPLADFDTSDTHGQRSNGTQMETSPSQALQAGFLCSRGRPPVAWNRQRWGESSNQSNFGLNCRLQSVDGARY